MKKQEDWFESMAELDELSGGLYLVGEKKALTLEQKKMAGEEFRRLMALARESQ